MGVIGVIITLNVLGPTGILRSKEAITESSKVTIT